MWHPLIEHIEALGKDPNHEWKENLNLHQKGLLLEMERIITSADEALDMDSWINYIHDTLLRTLQIEVPTRLIMQVVSPIVPLSLQPTRANALHALRSSLCAKVVGPALAAQASRKILAEISEVLVNFFSGQDMSLEIKKGI